MAESMTGFLWILPVEFYWALLDFISLFTDFFLGSTGFDWVESGSTGFYRVLLAYIRFLGVFLSFIGLYWVLFDFLG